jgi:hypothetical protein
VHVTCLPADPSDRCKSSRLGLNSSQERWTTRSFGPSPAIQRQFPAAATDVPQVEHRKLVLLLGTLWTVLPDHAGR